MINGDSIIGIVVAELCRVDIFPAITLTSASIWKAMCRRGRRGWVDFEAKERVVCVVRRVFCVNGYGSSHGPFFFSKLVAGARIENFESRTIFEKRNLLKLRAARVASNSFSQRLVFENQGSPECAI